MTTAVNHDVHKPVLTLALIVGLLVFATLLPVKAATIVWSLENARFDDGGTVTGSFVWDTDFNGVLSYNFTVTGGDTASFSSPFTYSESLPGHFGAYLPSVNILSFSDFSGPGSRDFRIGLFNEDLLNTPIAILALDAVPGTGDNGYLECFNCTPLRLGLAGAYLSAVPLPAAFWLFATALAGLVGYGRRKNRASRAIE